MGPPRFSVRIPGHAAIAQSPDIRGRVMWQNGKPVARFTLYPRKSTAEYTNWVVDCLRFAMECHDAEPPMFRGAVATCALIVNPLPGNLHRKREPRDYRTRRRIKPDTTNVVKVLEDATTRAGLWLDDNRVDLQLNDRQTAAQGEDPFVVFEVWDLPDRVTR